LQFLGVYIPGNPWIITDAAMKKLRSKGAKYYDMTSTWEKRFSGEIDIYLWGLLNYPHKFKWINK
jgi:hypothetical protein